MGYKQDFKIMIPNLLAVTGIIFLLLLFPSGWFWFVLAVTTPFVVKEIILLKSFSHLFTNKYLINILKTVIISSFFYWLIKVLGRYGWVGLIISVLGLSAYKLWLSRVFYLDKVREIEIMIWGHTNDKKRK